MTYDASSHNLWPITMDNHEIVSGRCLRQLCGGRQKVFALLVGAHSLTTFGQCIPPGATAMRIVISSIGQAARQESP